LKKIVDEYNQFNGDKIDFLDLLGSFNIVKILEDPEEDGESSSNESLLNIRKCMSILEEKSFRLSEGRRK